MSDVAATAFLASASAHAGLQATVTLVVYPTLSHVRSSNWRQAHDRYVDQIRPVVVAAYLLLVATGVWWLAVDWSALAVVAVVFALLTIAVTAILAAPLHRRLVKRDDATVDRLITVDRWRAALAFASVAAAIVAVVT